MIARPLVLPQALQITTVVGAPPLATYRLVVPIGLALHGADALVIDPAQTALAGTFALRDHPAPAPGVAALAGAAAGVLAVTLDTPRQVLMVNLANRPNHTVELLRLDANVPAPAPTATARNRTAFPDPPADFTDRRFALRARDATNALDATLTPAVLQEITVRSRPGRPRLGLAVPGDESAAVGFWSAPVASPLPSSVAMIGAGTAFVAALREHLDGLGAIGGVGGLGGVVGGGGVGGLGVGGVGGGGIGGGGVGGVGAIGGPVVTVSLVIESDTPCALTLTALEVSYRLVRRSFAAPSAGAGKVVLNVARDASEPVGVGVALPAGAQVGSASVATFESLPPERTPARDWGALAEDLASAESGIRVAPGEPASALVRAQAGMQLSRVALGLMALELPAELEVELFADLDGVPSGPALAGGGATLSAAGRQAWATVRVPPVAVPAGNAVWVLLSALRGTVVWLALPGESVQGRDTVLVRARERIDDLAVLVELLAVPAPALVAEQVGPPPAEPAVAPLAESLALSVGEVAVPAPPAVEGTRRFDIAAALGARLAAAQAPGSVTVDLAFRAIGPGSVTVYPPEVVYDLPQPAV